MAHNDTGVIVAVGSRDAATSNDGIEWTPATGGVEAGGVVSIAANSNGYFLGVGVATASSLTGDNWIAVGESANRLVGVSTNAELILAVDVRGRVMTSEFGDLWNYPSPGIVMETLAGEVIDVVSLPASWEAGFIAVGMDDQPTSWRSPDGSSWTNTPLPEGVGRPVAMASNNDRVVLICQNALLWSPNGNSWTVAMATGGFSDVTFGSNGFVAVGNSVAYSVDGVSWTVFDEYSGLRVAFSNDRYLLLAGGQGIAEAWTSDDGMSWTRQLVPVGGVPFGVLLGTEHGFVVVPDEVDSYGEPRNVFISRDDGASWETFGEGGPSRTVLAATVGPSDGVDIVLVGDEGEIVTAP
jgi:hypothetical protein